ASATRRSARIRHDRTVTLPAAGGNHQPLRRRRQRRNRRLPQRGRLGDLWQTREIGGQLAELLVIEILVGHERRHHSGTLANGGDELRGRQLMARERLRKSALALRAVTK